MFVPKLLLMLLLLLLPLLLLYLFVLALFCVDDALGKVIRTRAIKTVMVEVRIKSCYFFRGGAIFSMILSFLVSCFFLSLLLDFVVGAVVWSVFIRAFCSVVASPFID